MRSNEGGVASGAVSRWEGGRDFLCMPGSHRLCSSSEHFRCHMPHIRVITTATCHPLRASLLPHVIPQDCLSYLMLPPSTSLLPFVTLSGHLCCHMSPLNCLSSDLRLERGITTWQPSGSPQLLHVTFQSCHSCCTSPIRVTSAAPCHLSQLQHSISRTITTTTFHLSCLFQLPHVLLRPSSFLAPFPMSLNLIPTVWKCYVSSANRSPCGKLRDSLCEKPRLPCSLQGYAQASNICGIHGAALLGHLGTRCRAGRQALMS